RKPVSHKYSYGRALVIAGSKGFSGAPVLAANACERSGAGLTHLMVPDSIYTIAAIKCDGVLVTGLPATVQGGISNEAMTTILPHLEKASACCIGPGLSLGGEAKQVVKAVLKHVACPLVLDADALTLCAQDLGLLSECRAPLILTPHEGEFRRIGGDLTDGRLAGALRFTEEHRNVILILKGYGTLVCQGRDITVNPTGNPAMAKGGAGDVLCGILCGLLAQGLEPLYAARCAVFLHGLAGDLAALEIGDYSLAPSDLIRYLPKAFKIL
ncbi:MAG: NAD(P)H-hydrate dehydratase, partial [Oscillospiraceae bacterium]|nr:NAD(P)H-hydrate dehydratase [Oscillospiraceae bacterium]